MLRVVGFGHADVEGGTIPLAAPVPGQIEAVLIQEGERVRAGAPLVRLKSADARAKLAEAQAALRQAEIRRMQADRAAANHAIRRQLQEQAILAARTRLAAQTREIDHLAPLVDRNALPTEKWMAARDLATELRAALAAEELKLRQLELDDPQENIDAAEAAVRLAKARLDQAEDYLRRHTITAPEDGEVLRVLAADGQLAGPGHGPPIVWFAPDRPRIVRCEIDQAFSERVSPGMKAEVVDDRASKERWTGVVDRCGNWIAPRRSLLDEPFQKNDVRTLEVIVVLDPGQTVPRIGQRMRVTFRDATEELARR
jgi:multidrug resistance efflux pump